MFLARSLVIDFFFFSFNNENGELIANSFSVHGKNNLDLKRTFGKNADIAQYSGRNAVGVSKSGSHTPL